GGTARELRRGTQGSWRSRRSSLGGEWLLPPRRFHLDTTSLQSNDRRRQTPGGEPRQAEATRIGIAAGKGDAQADVTQHRPDQSQADEMAYCLGSPALSMKARFSAEPGAAGTRRLRYHVRRSFRTTFSHPDRLPGKSVGLRRLAESVRLCSRFCRSTHHT